MLIPNAISNTPTAAFVCLLSEIYLWIWWIDYLVPPIAHIFLTLVIPMTFPSFIVLLSILAKGQSIHNIRWWPETLLGVSAYCYYGDQWMPATIHWYSRILWGYEHESRTTSSLAFGWATSFKWSHGSREICKWHSILYCAVYITYI